MHSSLTLHSSHNSTWLIVHEIMQHHEKQSASKQLLWAHSTGSQESRRQSETLMWNVFKPFKTALLHSLGCTVLRAHNVNTLSVYRWAKEREKWIISEVFFIRFCFRDKSAMPLQQPVDLFINLARRRGKKGKICENFEICHIKSSLSSVWKSTNFLSPKCSIFGEWWIFCK